MRVPPVLRALLIALLLTAVPVGVAIVVIGGGDDPEPPEQAAYESTPLASYDTSTVAVTRAAFCDRLPDEAVSTALGEEPAEDDAYVNGERAAIAAGEEDVAHEYGCRFEAGSGALAEAWVFAPPITPERAEELAAAVRETKGCTPQPEAEEYGAASVALVCAGPQRTFASYRGLFGDAWLTCSLAVPGGPASERLTDERLLDRAGRWCVAVAEAASG